MSTLTSSLTSMQAQAALMRSPAISRARARLMLDAADKWLSASYGDWTVTAAGSYYTVARHGIPVTA